MPRDTTRSIVVALLIISLVAMAAGTGTAVGSTDEAFFAVEITGTNAPVEEGDTLVVNATVTNTGGAGDSQQIHFKNADNEIVDSVADPPLTLAPGERERVTLSWETAKGDIGTEEISVQSNDESPHRSVSIERGAFFDLTIVDTESPVSAGEPLNATVNVTMTGKSVWGTDVWFALGGSVRSETETTFVRNDTRSIELSWNDTDDYAGEWTLTAGVDDERAETTVTVDATDRSPGRTETPESATSDAGTETPTPSEPSEPTGTDPSPRETSTRTPTAGTSDGTESQRRGGFGVGAAALLLGIGTLFAYRFR